MPAMKNKVRETKQKLKAKYLFSIMFPLCGLSKSNKGGLWLQLEAWNRQATQLKFP